MERSPTPPPMIPADKQSAVEEALLETFGVTRPDDIQPMTKGLSGSHVFLITVRAKAYLMRVIPASGSRDNPGYYFSCMQSAAEAGLAPSIHYLNIEDGICITDFIVAKSFPVEIAVGELAGVVKQLHSLPKFANVLPYLEAADSFFGKFRQQRLLPDATMELITERYTRISAIYPRNDAQNLVSAHNDIKPDNIIWDGNKAWLVDWEAARLNDRYLDLAAIANFVVKREADELELLEQYFGRPVTEYERARLFLMSNIVHVFCLAICSVAAQGKPLPIDAARAGFNDYHQLLWEGKIDLGDPDERLRYGLVHLDALLQKTGSSRFGKSLQIIEASKH